MRTRVYKRRPDEANNEPVSLDVLPLTAFDCRIKLDNKCSNIFIAICTRTNFECSAVGKMGFTTRGHHEFFPRHFFLNKINPTDGHFALLRC